MATDAYSFIWQRTEMSALDSFCSTSYSVSIAGQVKQRLSCHCTAYTFISTLAPVLSIHTVVICLFLGKTVRPLSQQPLVCLHHLCGSTSSRSLATNTIWADFLSSSPYFFPLALFGLHLLWHRYSTNKHKSFFFFFSSSKCPEQWDGFTHQYNTSVMMCVLENANLGTQMGGGYMFWQTKPNSVQSSAKLSGSYPKANYQLCLDLHLGKIIASFRREVNEMADQSQSHFNCGQGINPYFRSEYKTPLPKAKFDSPAAFS